MSSVDRGQGSRAEPAGGAGGSGVDRSWPDSHAFYFCSSQQGRGATPSRRYVHLLSASSCILPPLPAHACMHYVLLCLNYSHQLL
ncbi:hypothetical protein [Oryza sativa Japonica Group]|uniref:Uncharacterized protein n=2 Tax=Oryza sativa subsp. japonica TaxID=39947 RepID=Q5JME0_ORYSJ|nr:hypothetical protein [Oryza sativa Japonica Group]BAD87412.1 hypothetical protein [Oryza sativa Japonica Group]